jgi:hypothetical protein
MERGKELKPSLLALAALSAIFWSCVFARDVPTSTRTFNSPVKVEGNRFVQDGREITVIGINYFPAYYPPLFPKSWLDSSNYRSEVVEDDLAAIEKLAFNLVSIQGLLADPRPSDQDCFNLRDFLLRARRHNLLVNLYIGIGGLVPIEDPDKLTVVPDACKLAGNSALFAYDIAWEPHFGTAAHRDALLQHWLRWLTVSYGSTDSADRAFGGTHAMPKDTELCNEAPSVRIAAFNRFLDQMLSRNYRDVRAALLKVDSTHLIGARSGYGGNGSRSACGLALVDLRAGAKHLDFISPEGYALDILDKNGLLNRGGFTTAYADVGKPILWAEFGINVDESCPLCSEQVQATFFSNMWELIRDSKANGGVAWYFAGVRPQTPADGEKSDFGIVYDYWKYPTSVDADGRRVRKGVIAFCTADSDLVSLTRWRRTLDSEKGACPRGRPSRGRFLSEAPASEVSTWDVTGQRVQPSGWQELCSVDDRALLVTTVDEGSREIFDCPLGYRPTGSFKPAAAEFASPIVAIDANGRSIEEGWLTLCARDNSATLKLVYNAMSGRTESCPAGSVLSGVLVPKSAPVFRPVAHKIVGALSGTTATNRHHSSWITIDRDAYGGAWKMFEEGTKSYAVAATMGQSVGIQTACAGSTSRTETLCVGNVRINRSCPAKCLDAEWNTIEIRNIDAQWQEVHDGSTVVVSRAAPIRARFSAGNIGESKWLSAMTLNGAIGAVRFGCNENAGGISCRSEISADVPGGSDAASGEVVISAKISTTASIGFQMVAENVTWFGERLNVTLVPK